MHLVTLRSRTAVCVGSFLSLAVLLVLLLSGSKSDVGRTHRLPDGSALELRSVAFTATNYDYIYQRGSKLLRLVAPILPPPLARRITSSNGRLGWSAFESGTNLIAITVNRSDASNWNSSVLRLRVADDMGNEYDACWGASMLGQPGEAVHGWRVQAFPRRCPRLALRFLAKNPDGSWAGEDFHIPNPLCAEYPHWNPEPWPNTKTDGDLAIKLSKFQAGSRMTGPPGRGDPSTAVRKTRLVFSFAEKGKPSDEWRIQKLTISDATGNRWCPYLNWPGLDFDHAITGTVELLGALWPGEKAWKLDVEAVRIEGFKPEQLWGVTIALPPPGTVNLLTNIWQHDGITVKLVAIAAPQTDHTGDFRWIARWWGEGRTKVYSLALVIDPNFTGKRLMAVRCKDRDGREVTIARHGNQDHDKQAIFLKPADDAADLLLTLAIQRSRFFEFVARPEFIRD